MDAASDPCRLQHYFSKGGTLAAGAAAPDAAGCQVHLSLAERQAGRWAVAAEDAAVPQSAAFSQALRHFLATGVCWLESDALPAATVTKCRGGAADRMATLRAELSRQRRELLAAGAPDDTGAAAHRADSLLRCDFAEITERDGGRIDVR